MREQMLAVVTSSRLGCPLTTEGFWRNLRRVDRPTTAGPNRSVDEAGCVRECVAYRALPARVGGAEEREHPAQGGVDVGDGEGAAWGRPDGGCDEAGVRVGRLRVAAVAGIGRQRSQPRVVIMVILCSTEELEIQNC